MRCTRAWRRNRASETKPPRACSTHSVKQLGVGEPGTDAYRRPPSPKTGISLERVVDLHIQCGSKGIQVGVHEASQVERWFATPIMDALCISSPDLRLSRAPWNYSSSDADGCA